MKVTQEKSEIDRAAEGKDKPGVELRGVKAITPANKEEIPIYLADYVLASYGTGAIMAVPAHDLRDFAFATKFKLPIKQVIAQSHADGPSEMLAEPYIGDGYLVNSGKLNGLYSEEAKKAVTEFSGGKLKIQYRLRDWLISRQR